MCEANSPSVAFWVTKFLHSRELNYSLEWRNIVTHRQLKNNLTPTNYKTWVQKKLVADIFRSAATRRFIRRGSIQSRNTKGILGAGRRDSATDFFGLASI
jgi:hypothetical protein